MKSLSLTLFFLFVTCWAAFAQAPFQLSLIPESSNNQEKTVSWGPDSQRFFYVVLQNTSNEAQQVFEAWNSWGYQAISFELILPSGEKILVSKKDQDFTKNYPSTFTLGAQEFFVFPIALNEEWEAEPEWQKTGRTEVKIKAIYELSPSKESEESKVWTESN